MQAEIFKMPPREFKLQNPMLKWGMGPEGKRCKHCKHLVVKRYANKYFKCAHRPNTNGPGTDHRVNWAACWLFEDR
jgi:hypothetical protein